MAHDWRRRRASAELASREGFRRAMWCFGVQTHQALRLSYLKAPLTRVHGKSLPYFIKVPDGVHAGTDILYKIYPPLLILPRLHHEQTWMNWFISFGDNVTVSAQSQRSGCCQNDFVNEKLSQSSSKTVSLLCRSVVDAAGL